MIGRVVGHAALISSAARRTAFTMFT
jgi:hypothetical protein